MPTTPEILEGLAAITNHWQLVAVAWHAAVGALLAGLIGGWRPSNRVAGAMVALSLASVSALAWMSGNPFNGAVFGFLSLTLGGVALCLPRERVIVSSGGTFTAGAVLLVFGWIYPHFLDASSWASYLYAAPLGLIPCPTVAAAIGLTFIVSLFHSRTWTAVIATAGLFYGVVGVFVLGVTLDAVLLAGAVGVAATGGFLHAMSKSAASALNTNHVA